MALQRTNGVDKNTGSLCESCQHAHRLRGYRESEELVVCNYDQPLKVPFKVRTCSQYLQVERLTWRQMHDLALTIGVRRDVGFRMADESMIEEGEHAEFDQVGAADSEQGAEAEAEPEAELEPITSDAR